MAVFVLNKQKNPLMPCSERHARLLLERGRAVIAHRYPFTIRLKVRVGRETQLQSSNSYAYFLQPTLALSKKEVARRAA
jgi:hypothetical protein